MALHTQVLLTCDVHDGDAEAVETVAFTVEGQSFECDLCEDHLAEFRETIEIWSSHARPVSQRRKSQRAARGGASTRDGNGNGPTTAEVREWARSQGMPIGDRGRLPAELRAAYVAAH